MNTNNNFEQSILKFCAHIGSDPLLVQGAGGNFSWKMGDTLWVKKSGTRLVDAIQDPIFVPVDLQWLLKHLNNGNFNVTPKLLDQSKQRPSIETFLHALLQYRFVLHLHPVEILSYLIQLNCEVKLSNLMKNLPISWIVLDYFRPGPLLAAAVSRALIQHPDVSVIFLKNHGVVIGANTLANLQQHLKLVLDAFQTQPFEFKQNQHPNLVQLAPYYPIADPTLHLLALNSDLFRHLSSHWALYPDHVVFLGQKATVYNSLEDLKCSEQPSELIFIHNIGVFTLPHFSSIQLAQLRCYYDILIRQPINIPLQTLTDNQVNDLLKWDAEQYRQHIGSSDTYSQ